MASTNVNLLEILAVLGISELITIHYFRGKEVSGIKLNDILTRITTDEKRQTSWNKHVSETKQAPEQTTDTVESSFL